MKNVLVIAAVLVLASCASKSPITSTPPAASTKVVEQQVPVPQLCKVEIQKSKTDIEQAPRGLKLEQQNTILRKSVAQLKAYATALEAGILGCGGKITTK